MFEKNYKFDYKPYTRKLKKPLRASYGELWERKGFIVRLKDPYGNIGFGDVAPLTHFSTETLEEASNLLSSLKENPFDPKIKHFPCIQSALESARWMMKYGQHELTGQRKLTMLLTAGRRAIDEIQKYLERGFSAFKWKIAVEANELDIFKELIKLAPHGSFRLDANGALQKNDISKWLDFEQVQFIEQPLRPGEETQMMAFGERIALDESAQRVEDMEKLDVMGWKGFIVVKPSFIGSVDAFLRLRESSQIKFTYSSSFESTIGMTFGLALAAGDKHDFSLGYGIQDYFHNDEFGLIPIDNFFIDFTKIRNIDLNAIWNALGSS